MYRNILYKYFRFLCFYFMIKLTYFMSKLTYFYKLTYFMLKLTYFMIHVVLYHGQPNPDFPCQYQVREHTCIFGLIWVFQTCLPWVIWISFSSCLIYFHLVHTLTFRSVRVAFLLYLMAADSVIKVLYIKPIKGMKLRLFEYHRSVCVFVRTSWRQI